MVKIVTVFIFFSLGILTGFLANGNISQPSNNVTTEEILIDNKDDLHIIIKESIAMTCHTTNESEVILKKCKILLDTYERWYNPKDEK